MENNETSKIGELNILIDMIVDYYSFRANIFSEDDNEKNEWEKDPALESRDDVIPNKMHLTIEKAFLNQLNKFTKE